MAQKLDEVTNKFFQNIIKTSWTWQRLTEEEKSRFENLDIFCEIRGTKDMREQWLFTIYASFYLVQDMMVGTGEMKRRWKRQCFNYILKVD